MTEFGEETGGYSGDGWNEMSWVEQSRIKTVGSIDALAEALNELRKGSTVSSLEENGFPLSAFSDVAEKAGDLLRAGRELAEDMSDGPNIGMRSEGGGIRPEHAGIGEYYVNNWNNKSDPEGEQY